MSITTILFDLDGTLLPMDNDEFTTVYFKLLAETLGPYGYDAKQLVNAVWTGTFAMLKNDGSKSNEEAFWGKFAEIYGEKGIADKPIFNRFYENEFKKAKAVCGYNPKAAEAVRKIKSDGYRVALATNPIFPASAIETRICWAGFSSDEFELFTSYENIGFCKPNPDYYREILKRLKISADECLMVGNDVSEDMIAESIGMNVFLLTDCLINKEHKDISAYPCGGFEQLTEFLINK